MFNRLWRYLNRKKNGEIKEYHGEIGNIIFRGEFLKGIKHGKTKENDKKDKFIFNGKYINGKKYQKNIKINNL